MCKAQSGDFILDRVIYDLYEMCCKTKVLSRGDTMYIDIDIYDWESEKDKTKEDYCHIMKRLSKRNIETPILFGLPDKPCTVYSIPYPLDEYLDKDTFSISIKDMGFYPEKKRLVIGGFHVFSYKWKKGRLKMKRYKEYGI